MVRVIKRCDPKVRFWKGTCADCNSEVECDDEDVFRSDGVVYFLRGGCPVCHAGRVEMIPFLDRKG